MKIENKSFPFKTALSKANVKTNRMRLQNGPITKSGVLPVTTLFFWKIFSSCRTSWKELIWCSNHPNVHIHIFRKRWSLILRCYFPVSILNPFHATDLFWYPLKTWENQWFSDVSRGYQKRSAAWNGLNSSQWRICITVKREQRKVFTWNLKHSEYVWLLQNLVRR